MLSIRDLYILNDEQKGRSVFCAHDIEADSIIECCPVIILGKKDTQKIHQTELFNYYFTWNDEKGSSAIPLGYGCLYNHDSYANAETRIDKEAKQICVYAIKVIPAGTEITINYWDQEGLSFEAGLLQEKSTPKQD